MKLSVVIAAYEMHRELPRTVMSCLPPLQQHAEGLDYEVVIIDNGSANPLDLSSLPSTAIDVRVIRIEPDEAAPSPVSCINDVVERNTNGELLLVCIDGARLFSSHIVRRTVEVLSRYPDAFTFVGSRHIGPKTQMIASAEGYDQKVEDELLRSAKWTHDLDRLWDVSVWAGAHTVGRLIEQNESNAFGLSRLLWHELGGYNPGFQRPGGGLCNLEFFERAVIREQGLNILLYGEATFHQYHGGAATSSTTYFEESQEEYLSVTGRGYCRPSYSFLADLGSGYRRMSRVGRHLRD